MRTAWGETAVSSQYTLLNQLWQPAASGLFGDLNNDGTIDIADALRALKISVGLITPTSRDWERGDIAPLVNGKPAASGKIDVSDVLVILERAVGVVSW